MEFKCPNCNHILVIKNKNLLDQLSDNDITLNEYLLKEKIEFLNKLNLQGEVK